MKLFNPGRLLILLFSVLSLSWEPAGYSETRHVDLVFCMDLSASTNGVLNDVRNRIWNIANGILRENEKTDLRIGVVGYGRPSFGGRTGFVKVISELSNDLDRASYNLFQLKAVIEKGDQFVPNALFETFKGLSWSKDPAAEKMVFLFGNGSVYTGSINLADICEEYKKNNIRINTIFVSQNSRIISQIVGYKKIAEETGGKFYIMTASSRQMIYNSPQLPPMVSILNDSLNKTFMFYSKDAEERKKFLFETDKNVMKYGNGYFYSRMLYKTSKHYIEGYPDYDLTSYFMKYNKIPERLNLDFLNKSENTMNISEIERRVHKKTLDRIRLSDEIKNIFGKIDPNSSPTDTLLDNFVLDSYH
ncbi:MAG: vWA domain-containing protein [Bacteroidota bacterium]